MIRVRVVIPLFPPPRKRLQCLGNELPAACEVFVSRKTTNVDDDWFGWLYDLRSICLTV